MPLNLKLFTLLAFAAVACTDRSECAPPQGAFTNREGQTLVFQSGGNGLWLTRFGTQYDTVRFRYNLQCRETPAALDLSGFNAGPFEGKTLFAIFEWNSDSSFRINYAADARPATFDADQTAKFYKR